MTSRTGWMGLWCSVAISAIGCGGNSHGGVSTGSAGAGFGGADGDGAATGGSSVDQDVVLLDRPTGTEAAYYCQNGSQLMLG